MKLLLWLVVLGVIAGLAGCAAPMATRMNGLSLGMSKAEAVSVMGQPESVSATGGVEFMNYRLATSFMDTDGSDTGDYFVQVVGGRVVAFGQKGDFNTTVQPQQRIQIETINRGIAE